MTAKVNYNDHPYRIVLSLIASHIMVMYNDPDSFFEALMTASYLYGMLASFLISYVTFSYIHYLTIRLDLKYEWHDHIFHRLLWQSIFGVFVPAILVFLMVTGYLSLYDLNIFRTDYLQQDFPLALLMLFAVNLYYFGLYHFIKYRDIIRMGHHNIVGKYAVQPIEDLETVNLTETTSGMSVTKNEGFKEVIMVDTLTTTIPVATNDIAYAFILSGTVFIRLKDMKSLNDSYQVSYTLKELEGLLNPTQFFRINRQMIVNITNFRGYSSEKKVLVLNLVPPPYEQPENIAKEHIKLHIVSEDRCTKFKEWIDR